MKATQLKIIPSEQEEKPLHLKTMHEIIGREYRKPVLCKPHFPVVKPEPVSHGHMGSILRSLTKKRRIPAATKRTKWSKALGWVMGGVV